MVWHALVSLAALCCSVLAEHPCSAEVASACADRPASDIGACLKDQEEHDYPTEISSACTDFIALNKACMEDLENFCDGAAFADDTIDCLSKRTPREDLSENCQKVMSWAVPETEAEEEQVVTDELGLSEQDYAEKKEWQKKRAAARGEAIERMKMKEVDRKKEEDRVALEEFKKNDPEGYAAMIRQQEEEARQQAEFKRKERARQAAYERAQKAARGEDPDADGDATGSRTSKKAAKSKGSWLYSLASLAVVGACLGLAWLFVSGSKGGSKGGSRGSKGGKKKKG